MKLHKILLNSILLSILIMGCQKEGCMNPEALNYDNTAKKDDGSCVLLAPEPDPREPYLGNYLVTDSVFLFGSFSETEVYELKVTTGGTTADTVYLNNLWNDGSNYYVLMSENSFTMQSQQVSGPYFATGTGDFTNNIITYETSGDEYKNIGSGPLQ